MSLLTFAEAQPHAERIRQKVTTKEMPPWYADVRYGRFKNARGLTQAQIDTLVAWASGGAPQGDGKPPSPPVFPPEGWRVRLNRLPDLVLDLPFGEFELPAHGEVPTFTVWMKLPLKEDRFIQAIEMRPSIRNAVHHSSMSLGSLPPGTTIGRAAVFQGGPVLEGVPVFGDGRAVTMSAAEQFGRPVMFYVSGGGVMQLADGLAKRFRRDDYLAWGLHLMSTGKVEKLRVQIGLWYARGDPHHEVHTWTVNQTLLVEDKSVPRDAAGGWRIPDIPPGVENWSMTGALKIDDDITIHSLWPHMHARGKDMTFVLTLPGGRQQTLLSVPHYNPHWQITYELAQPLRVRRGSTITAYGHYDNSPANPHNPAPDAAVRFGPQSTDEMYIPFIEVSVDAENLRLKKLEEFLR
jgi:copper type II ascorbate-dependent monooxygenase-like protein